jgi:hypothetical protein
MPLGWICNPSATFSLALSPPLFPSFFPAAAVKAFTLAPLFTRRSWWLLRPDLNRKPRRRLYLNLSLGGLNVHTASQKEHGKRAEYNLHDRSFPLLFPLPKQWIKRVRSTCFALIKPYPASDQYNDLVIGAASARQLYRPTRLPMSECY